MCKQFSFSVALYGYLTVALLGVFILPNVAVASGGAFGTDRFDSIESLGSCRGRIRIEAQHRSAERLTVWVAVPHIGIKNAVGGGCTLKMKQLSAQFSNWSLRMLSRGKNKLYRSVSPTARETLRVPSHFLTPGAKFEIDLTLRERFELSVEFRSPLLQSVTQSESCKAVVAPILAEERELRKCSIDADCSSDAIPFGCGCQFNKPIQKGSDYTHFFELISAAHSQGCLVDSLSTCQCEDTKRVVCRQGVCDWK